MNLQFQLKPTPQMSLIWFLQNASDQTKLERSNQTRDKSGLEQAFHYHDSLLSTSGFVVIDHHMDIFDMMNKD